MTIPMQVISAVFSGILIALAMAGASTGWLAAIALVPLLHILLNTQVSLSRALLSGWLCGLVAYGIHFSYTAGALHVFVFIMVLAYLALYPALFAAGVRLCVRRSREWGCLVAPCLWTALEYVRAHVLTGLQAGTLGASQTGIAPMVQIAAVTGVFGISLLLVTINVALARLLRPASARRPTIAWLTVAGVMLVGTLAYGIWALRASDEGGDRLRVATVQGEIDEREFEHEEIRHRILDRYRALTVQLADIQPEMTVYPETMTGSYLSQDSLFLSFIAEMGAVTGSAFLIGSRHLVDDGRRYGLFNSVFVVDAAGHILDRYDKIRLVPFGEYTPFGVRLPWLARFRISRAELTPGTRVQPIRLADGSPVGVGICYEAMYGADVRRFVHNGARLLVIVSDDFWFHGTAESEEFFNEAILRAVEHRMPVVRCANMGVSGIIDSRGRVISTSPDGQTGITYGTVHLRTETSIYTRFGDVPAWVCCLVSLILVGWCRGHGRTKQ